MMNNKNCFYMNEKFSLVVLQENTGDEAAKSELKAKIPKLSDNFDVYIVE